MIGLRLESERPGRTLPGPRIQYRRQVPVCQYGL